ncbi:hypothetical protein C0991_007098 [Blastosporella zonata]|nr:hypothetical protein C0991_007098 [Blastosporella zonata]
MPISHISSVSELDASLSKAKDKLSALSKQYTAVNFLKCDVDAAKDVALRYGVSAMPTFIFLKGQTKVDQVRGANKAGLEDALRRHSGPSSSATFSGKGQTLGGGPAPIDKADVQNTLNQATGTLSNLDPQVKVLLGLVGAYLLFWYLG